MMRSTVRTTTINAAVLLLLLAEAAQAQQDRQPICGGEGASIDTVACGDSCLRTDSICASCVNDVCVFEPPSGVDENLVSLTCPDKTLEDFCDVSFASNYCNGALCVPGTKCSIIGNCLSTVFSCGGTDDCPNEDDTVCDQTNDSCTTFNAVCERDVEEICMDTALYIGAPVRADSDQSYLAISLCSLSEDLCETLAPTMAPTVEEAGSVGLETMSRFAACVLAVIAWVLV